MPAAQKRQSAVLITGCTPGGIGHALALEFKSRGFFVIATVRNEKLFDVLRKDGLHPVQLDVVSEASIAECRAQVEKLTNGQLNILINNAGRGLTTPATDIALPDARAVYETNLFGTMAMVSAFVPFLLPTKGLIVNISSISALVPYVFGSVYCSSKAALDAYSRTLRLELAPFGMGVMVVRAGTVKSNIGANSYGGLPEGSMYQKASWLFERRLGWSQKKESGGGGPMETGEFAKKLVDEVMKGDLVSGNGLLARITRSVLGLGRQDWWFKGGMSGLVYLGTWFGEWVSDYGAWRQFRLSELEDVVKKEERQQRVGKKAI